VSQATFLLCPFADIFPFCNLRPVYEMVIDKEIIMRRRNDGYVNATHILKVANFDKPQRTRILEREVQTGQHEKVQGGYGKSQGGYTYIVDFLWN
jgi:hypothetical protein